MPRENIYIIGTTSSCMLGSKLPSTLDCLKVLFYNLRIVKLDLCESANLVIDECLIFWKKARIPTRHHSDCVKKIKKTYEEWRNLGKSKNKGSAGFLAKEKLFKESVHNLFDIAHADALQLIKIQEDKEFLLLQRQPGRPGCMLGVDIRLSQKEKRKLTYQENEAAKRKKNDACCSQDQVQHFFEDTSESEDNSRSIIGDNIFPVEAEAEEVEVDETSYSEDNSRNVDQEFNIQGLGVCRGKKQLIDKRVSAALDKCKVSDRDAVHLLTAFIECVGLEPADYIINRSSIRNARLHFREETAKKVRSDFNNFNTDFAVIHWDTKLLPSLTGDKHVDRIPIIVTAPNVEQLLGVPEISSGTGKNISLAVYDALENWSLLQKVQAFVFDTTSSNTGRLNGASFLLQQKLGREILFLACRHHVLELLLQTAVTEAKLYVSSGPDILIFKRLKNEWKNINTANLSNFNTSNYLKDTICSVRDEILTFCMNEVKDDHPRKDYKEFIELVIITLGGVPPGGVKMHLPGAFHHARWMAKGIYCLKIFLLRSEFTISKSEEKALERVCAFIIKIYIKAWCTATDAIEAPLNDFQLIQSLYDFRDDDEKISCACLSKFRNHLWYLSEECAVFSIFDERISTEIRKKMAKKLLQFKEGTFLAEEDLSKAAPKKFEINIKEVAIFLRKDFPTDFLSEKSIQLFKRFNISIEFLEEDPNEWNRNISYQTGKNIISNLCVINDTAERGVKLIEEFNDKITKNENQKQFLLQVVQKYRRQYPECTRKALKAPFV